MNPRFPIFTILLFISCGSLLSQSFSNDFLNIGVGARAHGMSGAFAATSNDVTAPYWNPAGLTQQTNPLSVAAMHAEWFAGIAKYDFIGVTKVLDTNKNAVGGIALIRFGIDQIPSTFNLINSDGSINYDNIYEFSYADYAVLLSYAQQVKPKSPFSIGGNIKIINRNVGEFANAWGFGLDAGLRYQKGRWSFALTARDITTTFNAWSFSFTEKEKEELKKTYNDIPENSTELTRPTFIIGASYYIPFNAIYTLRSEIDANFNTDGQRNVLISNKTISIDPKIGLELGFKNFLFVRAGLGKFQRETDEIDPNKKILTMLPTFGLGLKLGRLHIDYAQTNIGNISEVKYSNIFSLQLDFIAKKKSK